MSELSLAPGPAGQGPSARAAALLEKLKADPNDAEARNLLADIFGGVESDKDVRIGAPGTVERQDEHLKLWIQVMRLNHLDEPDYIQLSDRAVIDRSMKNATHEDVLLNLQLFVRGAFGFTAPRGTLDEAPRYETLVQYKQSALFWIQREMKKNSPPKDDLINAANQTLQISALKYGVNKKRKVKTYLGRYELAQLIDWDTARSPYTPVSESHHLAWCLALICGVRPGSIGRTDHRDDEFLCFREIELTRGSKRGMFNSKIQFLYLKGNRDSFVPEEGLTFSVNGSVHSGTLPMSIPHRLLIMLLRRGGLEAHDTLESLIDGDDHFIAIKDEFLDQPVCRMAGPRALSITEQAVSAEALTSYISTQGMNAGYPRGMSLYCWRRKAATTWMRGVGADRARQLMGHAHDSTELEDKYDQGFYDIAVFELAMKQDTTIAQATMDEDSSEVLKRMVNFKRLQGAFLARRVHEILEINQDYQAAFQSNDTRAMINLERRARDLAIKAFHDEQKKISDKNLTQTEFERRKAALKEPGELVKRIRDAVRDRMRTQGMDRSGNAPSRDTVAARSESIAEVQPQNADRRTDQAVSDAVLQELAQDEDLDGGDLVDIEDDYTAEGPQALLDVNADRIVSWDEGTEETEEEFAAAVEIFMLEMGKDRFYVPDALTCDLCRNSPYRSEADKNKVWPGRSKLRDHQLGKPHSKQGEIYLKLQYLKDAAGDERYKCPYGDCDRTYTKHEDLVRHIKASAAPRVDENLEADTRAALQLHDDEKRADGWYDDDFSWSAEKSKANVLNANRRRNLGLQYSNEKELPEPKEVVIQSSHKVVVGSGGEGALMTEIPGHYQGLLAFGDDPDAPYNHLAPTSNTVVASGINAGDAAGLSHPLVEIPSHLQATVALGDERPRFEHPGMWKDVLPEN